MPFHGMKVIHFCFDFFFSLFFFVNVPIHKFISVQNSQSQCDKRKKKPKIGVYIDNKFIALFCSECIASASRNEEKLLFEKET